MTMDIIDYGIQQETILSCLQSSHNFRSPQDIRCRYHKCLPVFRMCMSPPDACEEKMKRIYTTDVCLPVRIGYAGRIVVTQKRMDLMLKVIEKLEERKVPYIFEIAGDGSYIGQMKERVIASGWGERVRFVGLLPRERIPEFWRRQDIYVNIADSEGRSDSSLRHTPGY